MQQGNNAATMCQKAAAGGKKKMGKTSNAAKGNSSSFGFHWQHRATYTSALLSHKASLQSLATSEIWGKSGCEKVETTRQLVTDSSVVALRTAPVAEIFSVGF